MKFYNQLNCSLIPLNAPRDWTRVAGCSASLYHPAACRGLPRCCRALSAGIAPGDKWGSIPATDLLLRQPRGRWCFPAPFMV